MDKFASFISAHRAAVLLGSAAVVGSAAGAYYIYTSSAAPGSGSSKSSKKTKKSKKSKKSEGSSSSSDEITSATLGGFPLISSNESPKYPDVPEGFDYENVSEEDRKLIATQFKVVGNHFYSKKDYTKALEFYDRAIVASDDAVYHSNRAACYWAADDFENVIEESNKALILNPYYTKSYVRRAHAYEQLKRYEDSLLDYTSALVLSNFSDTVLNTSVDRILNTAAEEETKKTLETRSKGFPSPSFCNAFYRTIVDLVIVPEFLDSAAPDTADYDIKLALGALRKGSLESYEQAYELLNAAVEKGDGEHIYLALAHRSVLNYLRSDAEAAFTDATESIALKGNVISFILRATIALEASDLNEHKKQLSLAEVCDPASPFVKFHNSQLHFLMGQLSEARTGFQEAVELDPSFMLARVQICVVMYRLGDTAGAHAGFEELQAEFPHAFEPYNYEGEIYLDVKESKKAIALFDKAIAAAKENGAGGAINVTPLVNKALALFHDGEVEETLDILRKAIALDPLSDIAYNTISQVYIQLKRPDDAVKYMAKSIETTRTAAELTQTFTLFLATKTQSRMTNERPALKKKLEEVQAQFMASAYAQQQLGR